MRANGVVHCGLNRALACGTMAVTRAAGDSVAKLDHVSTSVMVMLKSAHDVCGWSAALESCRVL